MDIKSYYYAENPGDKKMIILLKSQYQLVISSELRSRVALLRLQSGVALRRELLARRLFHFSHYARVVWYLEPLARLLIAIVLAHICFRNLLPDYREE